MPKHNEDSKTRQVTLRRHVASPQFGSFHTFLAFSRVYQIWQPRIRFGTLFPSLSLFFLIVIRGRGGGQGHGSALTWSHSCQHGQRVVCERHAGGPRLGSQGVEIKFPRLLK